MRRIVVYEHLCSGALAGHAEEAELLPMGRQIRDAIAADLAGLPGWQLSVVECAAAPCTTPGAQALRRQPGESDTALWQRLAEGHDLVWGVAPETDDLLLRCAETVGAARWVGCLPSALRTASRKSLTLAALQAAGVPTPWDLAQDPRVSAWVVKPDDGAGAVDTWRYTDWAEARAAAEQRRQAGEAVTWQPWVDGPAMSVSLLCQPGQAELLSVNTQQLQIGAKGQVRFEGVTGAAVNLRLSTHRTLARLGQQVHAALPGLRGFVGVDLVWHAELGPVVIEVNPRVSCAYVGQSARLGRCLAAEILALHPAPSPEACCHAG